MLLVRPFFCCSYLLYSSFSARSGPITINQGIPNGISTKDDIESHRLTSEHLTNIETEPTQMIFCPCLSCIKPKRKVLRQVTASRKAVPQTRKKRDPTGTLRINHLSTSEQRQRCHISYFILRLNIFSSFKILLKLVYVLTKWHVKLLVCGKRASIRSQSANIIRSQQ